MKKPTYNKSKVTLEKLIGCEIQDLNVEYKFNPPIKHTFGDQTLISRHEEVFMIITGRLRTDLPLKKTTKNRARKVFKS